jgi:hypothetical protein
MNHRQSWSDQAAREKEKRGKGGKGDPGRKINRAPPFEEQHFAACPFEKNVNNEYW